MQLEHLDIMLNKGIPDYQTLLLEQWDILLNGVFATVTAGAGPGR